PRRTGWVQLQALQGLGFSELKFGVLDLSPEVQAAIGRSQSARPAGGTPSLRTRTRSRSGARARSTSRSWTRSARRRRRAD
ncbi:MAG TPA: hypothetical protein PLB01_17615, partial [Thermoanaerobaculia bacterium]|nr:hypothetical protein [Thermoanaerobaculia bacterium]